MRFIDPRLIVLGATLLVGAASVWAQSNPSTAPTVPPVAEPSTPSLTATPSTPTPVLDRPAKPTGSSAQVPRPPSPQVQSLMRQFDRQREQLLAQRQQELTRLQNASAQERERILAEMRALQGQRLQEQRELARKIREDLSRMREVPRPAGGGPGG